MEDTIPVLVPREVAQQMRVGAKLGFESVPHFSVHLLPAIREITRRRAAILAADRVTLTPRRRKSR